jgi:hypothetical protein
MTIPGQGEAELFATGPLTFTIKVQAGVAVVFDAGPDGAVTGVRVTLDGRTMSGGKIGLSPRVANASEVSPYAARRGSAMMLLTSRSCSSDRLSFDHTSFDSTRSSGAISHTGWPSTSTCCPRRPDVESRA